jgi:tRNA pseudouridine38-40 synthase
VWNIAPSSSALHRHFDFQRAQQACDLFQGKLNLKAFQGALRGNDRTSVELAARKANNTICNITEVSIIKEGDPHAARNYHFMFDLYGISPPEFLSRRGLVVGNTAFHTTSYVIVLRGDRFLYKMCRFVVGIIVAAGYGKVSLESIHSALQTGSWEGSNLKPNFECAPSHGLVLYNVEYPEALSPKWQE